MFHHCAYGLPLDQLDIAIVGESRPTLSLLRSLLEDLGVARVRAYDGAVAAISAMPSEPPNFLITDWRMSPMNGCDLISTVRHISFRALNPLPALLLTSFATHALVKDAVAAGATHVLTKPFSAHALRQRLKWVLADDRTFIQRGNYVQISGTENRLLGLGCAFSTSAADGMYLPYAYSQRTMSVRGAAPGQQRTVAGEGDASAARATIQTWEV
jgi:two-component system chemotaxis response regulator CheY